MKFAGMPLINSVRPGTYELKTLSPLVAARKASPADVKSQAAAAATKASIDALAAKSYGFGETYLPSISKLDPQDRPYILAAAKSIRNDPAAAAKVKFSDADGKKVASLDQYIGDLQSAIDNGFSGAA